MSPDDPRHGTERGHSVHTRNGVPTCAPCREAHRKMNILRKLYPDKYSRVPTTGARRRLQALQALGHGRDVLAIALGYTQAGGIAYILSAESKTVTQATHRRIADLYDRLSMTVPQGAGPSRARTWAKRHGFAPPLAWDNIDDPDETPARDERELQREAPLDDVAIERRLNGDKTVHLTKNERIEALRRWLNQDRSSIRTQTRGSTVDRLDLGSILEFERRTGITRAHRYKSAALAQEEAE